jgi:hypothetical protein
LARNLWEGKLLRRVAFAAAILLSLALPAQGQSVFNKPVGVKVQGSVEIGHARVPLPEGEWILLGKMEALSGGGPNGVPLHRVFLAQVKDKVLAGAVLINTNVEGVIGGWKRNTNCDRVDTHFVDADRNYDGKNRECFWVNHVTTGVGSNTWTSITGAYAYMDKNGIRRPSTVVAALYSISRNSNFVDVTYWFNPEVEGFDPPKVVDWHNNDWHKSRIVEDPKKLAYVEKLKNWGLAMYPQIKAAFGG